ncbi:hypothetical protein NQ317_013834 [Molorchus minor]|uniref:Uncharacterized protein n=1 Tax=Molorchus minor TaxID=1323400 RepID=A0ABQ9IYA1_9CUCU|nr:hypothetical protein NQ317_013834 [Molorchus minor]
MLFLMSAAVKLFLLACDEVIIVDEIVGNAAVTLIWSVTLIRSYVIASKRVQALVRNIFVLEERILKSGDERLIEIYNSHVNQNKITNIIILVVTSARVSQIRVLKYILNNFETYATKIRDQLSCSQEEASFITLRQCILKHKEIIWYINEYNAVFRYVTFLDFFTKFCSVDRYLLTTSYGE